MPFIRNVHATFELHAMQDYVASSQLHAMQDYVASSQLALIASNFSEHLISSLILPHPPWVHTFMHNVTHVAYEVKNFSR